MAAPEIDYSITTRLLTLLNVSATNATSTTKKRKRDAEGEDSSSKIKDSDSRPKKLNSRKSGSDGASKTDLDQEKHSKSANGQLENDEIGNGNAAGIDETQEPEISNDPYMVHFGPSTSLLTEESRTAADSRKWKTSNKKNGKLGQASLFVPDVAVKSSESSQENRRKISLLDKLQTLFEEQQAKSPDASTRKDLLTAISSYQDLYVTKQDIRSRTTHREVTSLHFFNHLLKVRRRILKNNEKLAHSKERSNVKTDPNVGSKITEDVESIQDQGFTRPTVLILAPFRSSAHAWVTALLKQAPNHQAENSSRFFSEFSLPAGAEDKLSLSSHAASAYPEDHIANMSGNIDDHFRVGIKVTRKSVKIFSDFYSSDIIIASPLGLRNLIDKERSADYLSSIDILVIDQLDVLTMQNWSHLQLIFKHLNKIPKESHDSDFSRIKPWHLDGYAAYLRQSILFSAYETPETRALFNRELCNVAGKQRMEQVWSATDVPEGARQNFLKFDCGNAQDENDKRFDYFTTEVFPSILRSAVQSANTAIFIPSYFDYARIKNWMKEQGSATFAVLSEDSDNRDISRARQAFFTGTKAMLLVTERFHFFRRYKLRGIRNLVFYAPPDHPQFYTEFLSFPFLDDNVLPSDITCKVIYSKYDYMRLERIVGSDHVRDLISQ